MACHCPTIAALITSGICARCDHHGVCENEALAIKQLQADMKTVTLKEAANLFCAHAGVKRDRARSIVGSVRLALKFLGRGDDVKVCEIMPTDIDRMVAAMRSDDAKPGDGRYSEETIKTTLQILRALDGKRMRAILSANGYDQTAPIDIDIKKYGFQRKPVQTITLRQVQRLLEKIIIMKHSDDISDRNVFLYLYLALFVGMARRDIADARWGLFQDGYDGKYAKYRRHKNGHGAGGKLTPQEWMLVQDMAGSDDEYILKPIGIGRGVNGKRTCTSIARRANKIVASCGIGLGAFEKRGHALRKFKAQAVLIAFGIDAASRQIGDTIRVTGASYANESSACSIMGVA